MTSRSIPALEAMSTTAKIPFITSAAKAKTNRCKMVRGVSTFSLIVELPPTEDRASEPHIGHFNLVKLGDFLEGNKVEQHEEYEVQKEKGVVEWYGCREERYRQKFVVHAHKLKRLTDKPDAAAKHKDITGVL